MRLHYRSPHGWLNDPHGVIHRTDGYHLFHQHSPETVEWDKAIRWGHAVGEDLFSLSYVGSAIEPSDGDEGIWTGCIVEDGQARVQLLAYDRKTLISQSDFVALPEGATAADGCLAVYTENARMHRLGITGVPCYIFNDGRAIAGAQEPEILVRMLDMAVAQDADRPPMQSIG